LAAATVDVRLNVPERVLLALKTSFRRHMFPNGNNGSPKAANPAITSRAGTSQPRRPWPANPNASPTARNPTSKPPPARRPSTGVGRRFILELEAGKASCQLGRALVVAAAVGLRPFDLMSANNDDDNALLPDLSDDLPDIEDDSRG
jgi:hypothetical protein